MTASDDLLDAIRGMVRAYSNSEQYTPKTAHLFVPQWIIDTHGREAIEQAATDEARRWGFADAKVEVFDH